MLGTLRSHAGGIFAKALLGLLVLSFAVWGIGDIFRSSGAGGDIANVDGKSITPLQYERALNREIEGFRRLLGDEYSPELLNQSGIYQQVLRARIETLLLQKEADSLGLTVSNQEIFEKIRNSPIFYGADGKFDKNVFTDTLQVLGMSEQEFVQDLKDQIQGKLIINSVTQPSLVPDYLVDALYRIRQEKRVADIIILKRNAIRDIPAPDEGTLKAYHEKHAGQFTAPEYRTLNYITLTQQTIEALNKITEEDIAHTYEQYRDDYRTPEKRKVEQLLYRNEDDAKKAYRLLKDGKDMSGVIKETPVINKDATSLGMITAEEAPRGAGNIIFSLPNDGFSEPFQSDFGWHIFRVTSIQEASIASLSEVREKIITQLKEGSREDGIYQLSNQLQDELAAGLSLAEAAKKLGLTMKTIGPVDAQGFTPAGTKAPGLPPFENFLATAFKLDEQTESPLTLTREGVYFLVHVERITPEHLRPLEDVRDDVMKAWKEEYILTQLSDAAERIMSELKAGSGKLDKLSGVSVVRTGKLSREDSALGNGTLSQSASPRSLIEQIFSLQPGQVGRPYKTESNDIWIPVTREIISAKNSNVDKAAWEKLRRELEENMSAELYTQYMYYLQNRYPVSINTEALQALTRTP